MKISYLITAAALLSVSAPVMAADCNFAAGSTVSATNAAALVAVAQEASGTTVGEVAPELMGKFLAQQSAERIASFNGCGTVEEFTRGFYAVNNMTADTPLSALANGFRLPGLVIPRPAAEPEATKAPEPEAAEVTAPETGVAVAVSAPVPTIPVHVETRTVRVPTEVNLDSVWAQINANKAAIRKYQAQPASERNSETDAAIAALAARMTAAEGALAKLPKEGTVTTVTLPAEQQTAIADVQEASSLVESYIGRSLLDWASVLGALAFFGLIGVGIWVCRKFAATKKAIDDIAETDLSGLASKKVVEDLQKQVTATADKLDSVADQSGHIDISFAPGQEEALAQMNDEEVMEVSVMVAGEEKVKIPFRRENGQFFIDLPKDRLNGHDPKVAVTPLKFVRRHFAKGMFDRLHLQSVNQAA